MTASTLTDFLLARIAEDRQWAESAKWAMQGTWYVHDPGSDGAVDALVAVMSPARVLAECEAKRRIVERWEYRWREAERAAADASLSVAERNSLHGMFASQATGLGEAILFLASVYADHPDYREEWRP